jgi:hypothetical protein
MTTGDEQSGPNQKDNKVLAQTGEGQQAAAKSHTNPNPKRCGVLNCSYAIACRCWRGIRWVVHGLNSNHGIITAIATVAIGIVAWLQWETFEKTDQTMKSGERAAVVSYDLKIVPLVLKQFKLIYWVVSPIIENAGNTSTQNMRFYLGRFDIVPIIPNLNMDPVDPYKTELDYSSLPNAVALGPKAKIVGTTIIITQDEAAQMRDKKLTISIMGQAVYEDVYGAKHETVFCYQLLGGTGTTGDIGLYGDRAVPTQLYPELSYRMCGHNNCTDKECGQARQFSNEPHPTVAPRARPN